MLRRKFVVCAIVTLSGLAGCSSSRRGGDTTLHTPAPRFDGMGSHARKVSTASAEAQQFFNQGLVWAYAFNHDEAIRSFQTAADADPNCAMAWWGVALCHGPHINFPMMTPARSQAAWEALSKARESAEHATAVECALIEALASRYANPAPPDRRSLDEAYASAMRRVWQENRSDADIGTLFAESLMDLQPWDLWTPDGQAKGNTKEILSTLEAVLALNPDHPGANHLYIHATEASPFPEKGDASAQRLRTAVPISGHLVHMPSHIDIQLGRWALAADQNKKASEADRTYRAVSPRQNFYRVYMAHNDHFLAFASMMEGRSAVALESAERMIKNVPDEFIRESAPWIDPVMGIKLDVLKRFGRWDDILREPEPRRELVITRAMWHFNRGLAYAAKGEVAAAKRERERFETATRKVPSDASMGVNPAHNILEIARHFLDGEVAYREGRIDDAVRELRQAVALEDRLRYMEPPEWIQPARHTLGAVLVDAKRYEEAEAVYREDLRIWPENGWSLQGLADCLRQRNVAEAADVQARFQKTWQRADVKIGTSCLCVAPRTS